MRTGPGTQSRSFSPRLTRPPPAELGCYTTAGLTRYLPGEKSLGRGELSLGLGIGDSLAAALSAVEARRHDA